MMLESITACCGPSTTRSMESFMSQSSSVGEEKKESVERHETVEAAVEDDILSLVKQESWYSKSLLVVVVGASGDLAKKKTYPSLYALWKAKLLPPDTLIWGFARSAKSNDEFRQHLEAALPKDGQVTEDFLSACSYRAGSSYGDAETLQTIIQEGAKHNVLIYLAIPPHVFADCTGAVMQARTQHTTGGFLRVILEKPFGRDTQSCKELLTTLQTQNWPEEELYRIDHYLGKEMVQNVLALRQNNMWMSSFWNKSAIQSVHLIFKEDFGTEGRGYFDDVGIIRDILQNHLMQVLSLIAMELPEKWTSESIRDAKVAVLKAMPEIQLADCLLGQYNSYKDDPSVENKLSVTPTYACIRCKVNNSTWQGVPFVLEAGKALNERLCEVRMHFRSGPGQNQPNALVFRLQPKPQLFFTANVKTPGFSSTPTSTHLGVPYENSLTSIPEAYTRLLLDVLRGQQANFVRDDELLEAWRIFTPILHKIEQDLVEPLPYDRKTTGPTSRQDFLAHVGVSQPWLPPPSSL